MAKLLKRTWGGIQFTFRYENGYGAWFSEDGIELVCGRGLASNISDHWCLWYKGKSMNSGMTAEEAVKIFLNGRRT
jgi:hypothetical protein